MIRVGMIGYGCWGPNLARCVAADPHCQLAAICDVSSERLLAATRAYPDARLERDWHGIVGDPQIDAIVIATPAALHFEPACAALGAGKHVLVEKPIAQAVHEVLALIDMAERKNLVLMTDHTYVYSPAMRAIRKLVTSGALGSVRRFNSVRTNVGTARHDVDVLWDLAAHDLSIIDFLFAAPPQAVCATGLSCQSGERQSRAAMCVYFPDALVARIRVDWAGPAKIRRIEIAGSNETLIFDDLEPSAKVRLQTSQTVNGSMDGASIISVEDGEPLSAVIGHLASCIQRRETPLSDGAAGLRVVRLLEAASRSLATAGSVVSMNAEDRFTPIASHEMRSRWPS